ncbi:DUF1153 domain-containing protein [Nitrospirillum sp. BR 11828]|uniref:CtrA inhibitor SciP n=1 Tax=Nitrospirillum sp. BR 11828 TaxID=3104325 RepID=UPI002ACA1989|nr:DUF1153 domain-containing protein [Nitrospirillum sp. BR 11828]MDZ5647747.1 DUF1153 domain-containing protein [Nitrospirillum sp. BR 11828]
MARTAGNGGSKDLTLDDLPPPDTKRWVMRRKAQVVEGVRNGLLTMHEACARYTLSEEEFLSWQRLIEAHGPRALRTTRLQDYRRTGNHPEETESQTRHGFGASIPGTPG